MAKKHKVSASDFRRWKLVHYLLQGDSILDAGRKAGYNTRASAYASKSCRQSRMIMTVTKITISLLVAARHIKRIDGIIDNYDIGELYEGVWQYLERKCEGDTATPRELTSVEQECVDLLEMVAGERIRQKRPKNGQFDRKFIKRKHLKCSDSNG